MSELGGGNVKKRTQPLPRALKMESRHKLRNESAFKSRGNEEPLSLELPEEIEPFNTTALATEVHVGHLDLMHSAQALYH